ncbi:MAG: two-component system, cell cycle sensor histidine kinase and response regulator CckA, partial [Bacteroidota bacterium]|nr:two-component system, cell cycle sensor histidine kinase and response regulator CckA [Bacteroidota bacterium]
LFSRDFMAEGGEIIIGVSKHTTCKALITISDTGIGLSGDDISRLFEPYNSNIKESGKRTSDLYLVKNIIQQHKGTISVISEVGKGTTVRITFPTAKGRKRK